MGGKNEFQFLGLFIFFTFVVNYSNGQADYSPAVIIHCTDEKCDAGFAGDDEPRATFTSVVGRPTGHVAAIDKKYYVGEEIEGKESWLQLSHPIKNNIVQNFDDFEQILQHCFFLLRVERTEQPVFFIEPPSNPLENRKKTVRILFDVINAPALYLADTDSLQKYIENGDVYKAGALEAATHDMDGKWVTQDEYSYVGADIIESQKPLYRR